MIYAALFGSLAVMFIACLLVRACNRTPKAWLGVGLLILGGLGALFTFNPVLDQLAQDDSENNFDEMMAKVDRYAAAHQNAYTEVAIPDEGEFTLNPREEAHLPIGSVISGDVYLSIGGNQSFTWTTDGKELTGQILVILRDDVWVRTQDYHGAYVHAPGTDPEVVRQVMKSPNGGCGLPEGCYKVLVTNYTPTGIRTY